MLIDTHSHIYVKQFDSDLQATIDNALTNNVKKILLPNIDSSSINRLKKLSEIHPNICKPMMGLHPCSVKEDFESEMSKIKDELFSSSDYIAVGEIGLDYHWDLTFKEQQKECFIEQINWAKELELPFVIHCRKAYADVIEILEKEHDDKLKGVLHCFGGTLDDAKRLIDLGFYLGIGGVLTFKNAGLQEVIADVDMEHLILETDSPYLAPVPYRGKRNESAYTALVAEKLADVKNITLDEVAETTTNNATKLFGLSSDWLAL